jgi:hypothetical protein
MDTPPAKPSKPAKTSAKATPKPSATKPAKKTAAKRTSSFDPPQEPQWHRMIAEAAYYRAEKRGFAGDQSLEDWLAAEEEIRKVISP